MLLATTREHGNDALQSTAGRHVLQAAGNSIGGFGHYLVVVFVGYIGVVDNSVTGQSYQQFAIPPAATTATLSFWLNVTSAEITATTRYDTLNVEVRDTAGTLLGTVATYSNLDKGTAGVYTQRGGISLLAYRGQTIRLQFRVSTDSSAITTFRVDDVAVN